MSLKPSFWVDHRGHGDRHERIALNTVAQLRAFLGGTLEVEFSPLKSDSQRYAFISTLLKRFAYTGLGRVDKGVVLRYLQRTTGYSRQQLTRLVCRATHGAPLVKRYRAPAHAFVRKFTPADVALLAETDWGTNAGSVLTEIHLADGDVAAALVQAREGGCSQTLWFKVAAACEPGRAGDAVAIYLEHLEHIIDGKNDRAYDEAAALLRKVGALMRRQGQAAGFLDVLAGVLTRHKAKRNLMKRLERVAAEARKQGVGK